MWSKCAWHIVYKGKHESLSLTQSIMSGCAIGPDGTLLDASNIVWYHNADDDTPISAPPASAPRSDLGPPVSKIAGSRRPQRTLRLSTKAHNPNSAELKSPLEHVENVVSWWGVSVSFKSTRHLK